MRLVDTNHRSGRRPFLTYVIPGRLNFLAAGDVTLGAYEEGLPA